MGADYIGVTFMNGAKQIQIMKTDETIKMLSDKTFLDKLYGYAYHRCRTSHEAEDLCSEIILSVLRTVQSNREIENFYPFVWTVAHRTYADYCEKRKTHADAVIDAEYSDHILNMTESPIEDYLEKQEEAAQLSRIMKEISFLSKIYRDVMVLYYLEEMKIAEIARSLGISQTTVKQRLFSARNIIKKEVQKMENINLSLKPVNLQFIGTGSPIGNDPSEKARERLLSQNLIFLCKDEAKTAKELSEALGVPMLYVENEIEIQCKGVNGSYGLLRKLGNGKYISNILIAEAKEYDEANSICEKYLKEFGTCLKTAIKNSRDKILSFPFLNKQQDIKFILWSLLSSVVWSINEHVNKILSEQYFSDVTPVKRDFTTVAIVVHENEVLNMGFYGCDGVTANGLCGYARVFFSNIYSDRIEKHFGCGHNLSTDPQILLTIRSIGGLDVDSLSEAEKEIAAKAIECGYLCKNGNTLEPRILVFKEEDQSAFYNLLSDFDGDSKRIAEKIARDIAAYMKKQIPKHLIDEYQYYNSLIASARLLHSAVEECIKEGLLIPPKNRTGPEGTFITVKK